MLFNINGEDVNLELEISKPKSTGVPHTGKWLKGQYIKVTDQGKMIAIIIIETILLTQERDSYDAFEIIDGYVATDWEIPLHCIDGHQLDGYLLKHFNTKASKKTKTKHILIEELSVHPDYRRNGIAEQLIAEVAKIYKDAQSIWLQAYPITKKPEQATCDYSKALYEAKNPSTNDLVSLYNGCGFAVLIDEKRDYPYMVSTPKAVMDSIFHNKLYI